MTTHIFEYVRHSKILVNVQIEVEIIMLNVQLVEDALDVDELISQFINKSSHFKNQKSLHNTRLN